MELPGTVALGDGRYLDRTGTKPLILVVETEGGLPPVRRKRRRPRTADPEPAPGVVPVTVATVVFAGDPVDPSAAGEWLRGATAEPRVGELIEAGLATLDRAVAAVSAITGRAVGEPIGPDRLAAVRIGFGEGERVYEGRYTEALEVDPAGGGTGARRERIDRIVPLARIAAVLAGRERLHACEVMVPRVRSDLDGDRLLPAALTIGEAVRATVAELEFALENADHEADLDRLEELLPGLLELPARLLGEGVKAAGAAELPGIGEQVESALGLAERVIRRYRISTQ